MLSLSPSEQSPKLPDAPAPLPIFSLVTLSIQLLAESQEFDDVTVQRPWAS